MEIKVWHQVRIESLHRILFSYLLFKITFSQETFIRALVFSSPKQRSLRDTHSVPTLPLNAWFDVLDPIMSAYIGSVQFIG